MYNNFSQLNSLNPERVPDMSAEDIAREFRELELLANSHFMEVPPGMSLLDDEFPEQNVNQSTMLVGHDLLTNQTQSQQPLQYYTFALPVTTTSNDNYTSIFPATPVPVSVPTNVVNNNSVILSKETHENTPDTTPTTEITTDSKSTADAKTTAATRKNSSTKSNQLSNSETTQHGSAEAKEDEKDSEITAKLAAEEDKRRRNTAASARFRVKKKMREQALERTAREMTTKAEMFEGRVRELEMEIKWLRSLIVEKDARLLDVERPGKKRKKDESEEEDDDDEKEKEVKQEQSDQTNQKE